MDNDNTNDSPLPLTTPAIRTEQEAYVPAFLDVFFDFDSMTEHLSPNLLERIKKEAHLRGIPVKELIASYFLE